MKVTEYAITELTRSMEIAAKREEYASASNMKRIKEGIENHNEMIFTEYEIAQLQSRIYKITGNGEVMQEFNKLFGIAAG